MSPNLLPFEARHKSDKVPRITPQPQVFPRTRQSRLFAGCATFRRLPPPGLQPRDSHFQAILTSPPPYLPQSLHGSPLTPEQGLLSCSGHPRIPQEALPASCGRLPDVAPLRPPQAVKWKAPRLSTHRFPALGLCSCSQLGCPGLPVSSYLNSAHSQVPDQKAASPPSPLTAQVWLCLTTERLMGSHLGGTSCHPNNP